TVQTNHVPQRLLSIRKNISLILEYRSMRMAKAAMMACVLLQSAHARPGQQSAKNSLEGVVVRAGSDAPVGGAQITLTSVLQPTLFGQPGISAISSPEGKFVFDNVAPGNYRLIVSRDGYVRQEYGARQ